MRVCPSCGFVNEDDATRCVLCGRELVPSAPAEAEAQPAVAPRAEEPSTTPPPPPPAAAAPSATATPLPSIPEPPAYAQAPVQPPAPAPPVGMPYAGPPPLPLRPPRYTRQQWRNRYLLGLGLGALPVLIIIVYVGTLIAGHLQSTLLNTLGPVLLISALLYVAGFIAMIVCLAIERTRPIGYGLLTMVVAGPIIAAISCFAAFALSSRPA